MYLIAEIGMNHEGSLNNALKMVQQVAEAGWSAAKFQTYTAEKLASKSHSPSYWDTSEEAESSQFKLFDRIPKLSWEDYNTLSNECTRLGIDFLTTPFDVEVADQMEILLPKIKVASADITNVPLLRKVACFGKPILLSCGAATDEEIEFSLETLRDAGATNIAILHCVLNYPTNPKHANLWRVSHLQEIFPGLEIGYSDHTRYVPGVISACAVAAALGASIIEKHVTFDRSLPGNDHYHAADLEGMREIKSQIDQSQELFGVSGSDFLTTQSLARANARRRIFASDQISQGESFSEANMIPLRSTEGVEVRHWDSVVGRRAVRTIPKDSPIFQDDHV